jgi:hypothetical protein
MLLPSQEANQFGATGNLSAVGRKAFLIIGAFIVLPTLAVVFSEIVSAQNLSASATESLAQQKADIEARIDSIKRKQEQATQVLQQAQTALVKAQSLNDTDSESIARQAIATANEAIESRHKQIQEAQNRLAFLNRALLLLSREQTTMAPAAGALVQMLNGVAQYLKLPKGGSHQDESLNCRFYFQGLGRELRKRGLPATSEVWSDGHLQANQITQKIESDPGEWQNVKDEADVQKLANQGIVVVGVSSGQSHGHIAIAFPAPPGLDPSQFRDHGHGPFVRDGNEHPPEAEVDERLYASTWGAVQSSKAYAYGTEAPRWYVWVPSMNQ